MSDNNLHTELLDNRIQKALDEALEKRVKSGGGSDGDGRDGSMDWKQSVETRLGQLHSDIRLGAGGLGAIFIAIIGLYIWTGTQIDGVKDKFPVVNEKISAASEKIAVIDTRSQSIENTVTSIDRKIDLLDDKMNRLVINGGQNESQRSSEEKQDGSVRQGTGEGNPSSGQITP